MANTIIWQNPNSASDAIEFNDDDTNAEYYRFRIDTGWELTLKRDATNSRTVATLSGATFSGVLDLNGNGEIWTKGDLKIRIDSDGGGSNRLIVQGSAGTNLFEIDESGNVSALGNFRYIANKSRTLVLSHMPTVPVKVSGYADCHWSSSGSFATQLIANELGFARAEFPLVLPQGAIVTQFAVNYRKTPQNPAKERSFVAYLYEMPAFGTTDSIVQRGSVAVTSVDGGTDNAVRSSTISGLTIDNSSHAYTILVGFRNEDTNFGGVNGIAIAGFKLWYDVPGLGL